MNKSTLYISNTFTNQLVYMLSSTNTAYSSANSIPTKEQEDKVRELSNEGYLWDKEMSLSACGVVLRRGNDIWFFGLSGEIMHNPEALLSIKL